MNKKILVGMFALSSMVVATSCSNDDLFGPEGDKATVSFNLLTESATGTRAISDGSQAQKLNYAVFDESGALLSDLSKYGDGAVQNATGINTESGYSMNITLAKGQTYTVAFWAESQTSPYTLNVANNTFKVGMNYDSNANNNEARDAFFGTKTIEVTENGTYDVTLTRPFAQINVGTGDFEAAQQAGMTVATSSVKIVNAATTLNVLNGEAEGEASVNYVDTSIADITESLTVDGTDYKWLSMCYVLPQTADASTTVSTEFEFKNAESSKTVVLRNGLENTPIQRNYRTNIVGDVLTTNANFNIVIDSDFQNSHVVYVWNGVAMSEPALIENTYHVKNAAEWAWLTQNETQGAKDIVLDNDIDFGGHEVGAMLYAPNFDGNGKTMSNLVISYAKTSGGYAGQPAIGLFKEGNRARDITIKNLTLKNIKVDNDGKIDKYVGALLGEVNFSSTIGVNIEGVTIDGADLNGVNGVGGLIGMMSVCSAVNVSNTKVINSNIRNRAYAGESGFVCGLVGRVQKTLNIGANVIVKDNTITGYYAGSAYNRPEASIAEVAAIRGGTAGVINGTATAQDNTITRTALDDISADLVIRTAADLVAFANDVNVNHNKYIDKTVALANDIDLAGINWEPIGVSNWEFYGIFDGRGYTIKNMNVHNTKLGYGDCATGLFGWLNGIVKNLNIDNATVVGYRYVGAIAGATQNIIGRNIENCVVRNSHISGVYHDDDDDGGKCGAVVGISYGKVGKCSVIETEIDATKDAGQVVGAGYANVVEGPITIVNVRVRSNNTSNGNVTPNNIRNEYIGRILEP